MQIEQAGPVAILIAGILGLWRAFIRGDIVPGSLYRDERELRRKAETQAERNTEALEAVVLTVKTALEQRANPAPPHE